MNEADYREVLARLRAAYPDAKPALEYKNPFELLVSTILAAQCTDKMVNRVTEKLYPVYGTPEAMAWLTPEELEPWIHSCGFYHAKAKNIVAMAKRLVERYGGEVPHDRDELTTLPGVGRKTANVVVSNAFGVPAIAVDTHVHRVTNRIGLADADDVLKTEQQLMAHIPEADWGDAHHWLIYHGRQVCSAQRPKCAACPLNTLCDAFRRGVVGGTKKETKGKGKKE
ncbi:MAG: endonuclease III [Clostridia bacterium]|nr:endonuclease III [Clostridia bacterium]